MRPLFLQHNTSFENAIKIFESGFIYTDLDSILKQVNLGEGFSLARDVTGMKLEDYKINIYSQYPGVYTSLVTSENIGKKIQYYPNTVNFAITLSLLNRKDWHFNKLQSEGFLNYENTITTKEALIKYLDDMGNDNSEITTNELVFHHSVPINFICEIFCKDAEDVGKLWNMAPIKHKKLIMSLIRTKTHYTDDKYDCGGPLKALTPNYCFIFDSNFHYTIKGFPAEPRDRFYAPNKYYKWMAKQCGLSDSEIDKADTLEELNEKLEPIVNQRFYDSAREDVYGKNQTCNLL